MSSEAKPDYKRLTAELLLATSYLMKRLKHSKDFQDFVKARKSQKMAEGINLEAIACAGRIIAKYKEIGIVEFSEIAEDLREDFGADDLRLFFPALKAAYGSIVAKSDDSELTPMRELEKSNVENFVN